MCGLLAWTSIAFEAHAQNRTGPLPGARLCGTARLAVLGFGIYTARLWVGPDFRATAYADHAFALELAYLRSFDGQAIAQRSLTEMQRIAEFTPAQGQAWLADMTRLFPNVGEGDRLTGIHQPGAGVRFLFNDRPLGEVRDPEFGRVFMGIWLSPGTSEPTLRSQLLAGARP
ncbi:MAG: chalcone isomerase family protein [Ramlibacter sp.]|nr:chalcone isomerase family protein [Ramlibacter sp.]